MSNLRYGIHLLRKYANLPEIPSRLKSMDQRHHSRQGREQRKESRSKISKYQNPGRALNGVWLLIVSAKVHCRRIQTCLFLIS